MLHGDADYVCLHSCYCPNDEILTLEYFFSFFLSIVRVLLETLSWHIRMGGIISAFILTRQGAI